MKTKPISFLITVFICFGTIMGASAQMNTSTQLFAIHEDVVIPSRVAEYEEAARNLARLFEQHNIPSMQYRAAGSDDFVYVYISPVENYAALDKMNAGFVELQKKMGQSAFANAMDKFNGNYHSHRDYMLRMHPELSYKPEYGNDPTMDMNFRHWDFYHVYPGKETEIEAVAKEWISLNQSKNIEQGYRLYMGDMGTDMPMVLVSFAARNATEYYANSEKNMKALGEEGEKLIQKTMSLVWKYESKDGAMRPDLSYIVPQVARTDN